MNSVHDDGMVGRPQTRVERLDQEAIVAAALRVASSGGVDALTMRTLTAELQVSLGAVYNHVQNRESLLALVADEVLLRAPSLQLDVEDPWPTLTEHILGTQDLLDQHPGLDLVVMQRSPHSDIAKHVRADLIELFEAHGFSTADAHHVLRSVTWLWLGARISLGGRPQTSTDRANFARALNDMVISLRGSLTPFVILPWMYAVNRQKWNR